MYSISIVIEDRYICIKYCDFCKDIGGYQMFAKLRIFQIFICLRKHRINRKDMNVK